MAKVRNGNVEVNHRDFSCLAIGLHGIIQVDQKREDPLIRVFPFLSFHHRATIFSFSPIGFSGLPPVSSKHHSQQLVN